VPLLIATLVTSCGTSNLTWIFTKTSVSPKHSWRSNLACLRYSSARSQSHSLTPSRYSCHADINKASRGWQHLLWSFWTARNLVNSSVICQTYVTGCRLEITTSILLSCVNILMFRILYLVHIRIFASCVKILDGADCVCNWRMPWLLQLLLLIYIGKSGVSCTSAWL
jgi:hypothetical protein